MAETDGRLCTDEFVYHITHDRQVDWLLPGVPATNKKLSIPMLAVVNIRGDRLYNGQSGAGGS